MPIDRIRPTLLPALLFATFSACSAPEPEAVSGTEANYNVELDVAQQQRHKGAPPQHRGLSLWILRLVLQLLQQLTGQPMGFGVVALA